jgi:hypothetical protein
MSTEAPQLQFDYLILPPNLAAPHDPTPSPKETERYTNFLDSSILAEQISRLGCSLLGRKIAQANILTLQKWRGCRDLQREKLPFLPQEFAHPLP